MPDLSEVKVAFYDTPAIWQGVMTWKQYKDAMEQLGLKDEEVICVETNNLTIEALSLQEVSPLQMNELVQGTMRQLYLGVQND